MTQAIVTTTVYEPSEALRKFSQMKDWTLVVVGDNKTPERHYKDLDCIYLSCEDQKRLYPALSELLGWSTIDRRNIGFLYAYDRLDTSLIASVDDDNIPTDSWNVDCCDCLKRGPVEVTSFENSSICMDPLAFVSNGKNWHRGFPLELVSTNRNIALNCKKEIYPLVQVGFWSGEPDIDAIQRIYQQAGLDVHESKIESTEPICFNTYAPFNSQNTVFKREAMPYFCCLPGIGRMDDIWGSYLFQKERGKEKVVYKGVTVKQERNVHDLTQDLKGEMIGYNHTLSFLESDCSLLESYISFETSNFYRKYRMSYDYI